MTDSPLARASQFSRYVRRVLDAEPDLAERVNCASPYDKARMRERLAALCATGDNLGRALRRLRKEVMIALIGRDLTGAADLPEVLTTVSALAEISIEAATGRIHSELVALYGEPRSAGGLEPQQLHVVGMGKLGGGELNVSSDVDLILLYP